MNGNHLHNGNGFHHDDDESPAPLLYENVIALEDATAEGGYDDDDDDDEESIAEEPPEPGTEEALEFGSFAPPLYRQRYFYALDFLNDSKWNQGMARVVDLGCSEGKFLRLLKDLPRVREIIGVDIDSNVLEEHARDLEPIVFDFLHPRKETPLDLYLMQGSISDCDNRLKNVDAVTAIEMIEHLTEDALEAFPQTVFEHMRPKIVLITTPNAEYNVLFPNFEGPFRHYDHKFEWTRKEFQSWVESKIIDVYPDYEIESFSGVGEGPDTIGFCSQLVIIIRKDFKDGVKNGEYDNISLEEDDASASQRSFVSVDPNEPYKIVVNYQYPMRRETRSRQTIVFDESNFHLYRLAQESAEWENEETALIDLQDLIELDSIRELEVDMEELCDILQANGISLDNLPNGSPVAQIPYPEESDDDLIEDNVLSLHNSIKEEEEEEEVWN